MAQRESNRQTRKLTREIKAHLETDQELQRAKDLAERVVDAANSIGLITLCELNGLALACRETRELRLTDTAMGAALNRLLRSLEVDVPFSRGSRQFRHDKCSELHWYFGETASDRKYAEKRSHGYRVHLNLISSLLFGLIHRLIRSDKQRVMMLIILVELSDTYGNSRFQLCAFARNTQL